MDLSKFNIKTVIPIKFKTIIKRSLCNLIGLIKYTTKERNSFDKIFKIIFICKGNICRSAFAEYYIKTIYPNLEVLDITSCGLEAAYGAPSPPEAIAAAKELNIDLTLHRSRALSHYDISSADIILLMEYNQYFFIQEIFPECKLKICLLSDFSPTIERIFCNIYDPYGHGISEFRNCFKRIQRALDNFAVILETNLNRNKINEQ